jgi:hypothetical protein
MAPSGGGGGMTRPPLHVVKPGAEPHDRIEQLRAELRAANRQVAQALLADLTKAHHDAERVAADEDQPPGIREFARQIALLLGPRLISAQAILERGDA